MFRNKKIVVWAFALALFALAPKEAAAFGPDCTEGYLLCLNSATQFDGGLAGTMGEAECLAEWAGCVGRKFWFG